jgi:methylenetetrahydrofolate--tRNA-(uracil-5-)-methyltransferase
MGLTNAHNPTVKPYAVVQLRQDNALGTLYNIVGFQTKLKHGEQARIFRMIPGLEQAEFARLGGLHRNTYINSPKLLDGSLQLKSRPGLRFAGQITGCEGYVESASIGLLAGRFAAAEMLGLPCAPPPVTSAIGSLLHHITTGHVSYDQDEGSNAGRSFQPMNVNFGLMPPIALEKSGDGKRLRGKDKAAYKQVKQRADARLAERQHLARPGGIAEQRGGGEVHAAVGRLGRQDHRDQQLERRLPVELALRMRVGLCEPLEDRAPLCRVHCRPAPFLVRPSCGACRTRSNRRTARRSGRPDSPVR